MNKEQVTIKIWKDSRKKLRLLYAELDESMVSILDRLIDQEMARIKGNK